MAYTKRHNGRKFDETREIVAKVGVIKNADGSAYYRQGDTEAYAAVYGPRQLYPSFLKDPSKGRIRCYYNMLPFSGMGDRVRPGPSRRSKEISLVTEKAFQPVINLEEFPNTVVDVFIELTQTDAGSRCAGICAASMALADAGIPMKDLVVAVSVGKVGKRLLVDLDYEEEAYEDEPVADMPIAILPRTREITLLQMDGQITKKEIMDAIKLGEKAIQKIYNIQKEALRAKFANGGRDVKRK
ncbi:exosome complex exonuclease Rrp41 [Candidatus Woesearchaeota archaeon]|nr:MAG: exosome complex exonuclease Rrp41 [Candidatus Woesearchaeota archaeon]